MKLIAYLINKNGEISKSESEVKSQTSRTIILDKILPEGDHRKRFQKTEVDHIYRNRVVCSDDSEEKVREELFDKFEADIDSKIEDLQSVKSRFNHFKNKIK